MKHTPAEHRNNKTRMRLSKGHLRWVYTSGIALLTTGVLWLLFHYFVQAHGEFGDRPHALEVWWLRLHGAAAMLMLAVLGSLLPIHVRRGWHQRKNLLPGISVLALALLLILSGYALYYFGSEEMRPWISAVHWVLGLVALPMLIWHIVSGRRAHAARNPERHNAPAVHRASGGTAWNSEQRATDRSTRKASTPT